MTDVDQFPNRMTVVGLHNTCVRWAWISVKDSLPDNDRLACLAAGYEYDDPKKTIGVIEDIVKFIDGAWCGSGLTDEDYDTYVPLPVDIVTHWMPLPEAPNV